jgi:hypothetical protein
MLYVSEIYSRRRKLMLLLMQMRLLFCFMQDHKLIVPTGMKRVGTAAQADNDKVGATVLIACEFKTSMIIPPMIIFTGVYGAKLIGQWEAFEGGKIFLLFVFIF